VFAFLAEHRQELFPDSFTADLFPSRTGRPSLSGVLLADPDGVYDPGYYNDRLLLGLKGTKGEAELCLIRQRMLSGKLARAERGEPAIPLPVGYVRHPSGEAVFDLGEQAQHVVPLVFGTFRRLGTLNSVLRCLVEQEVQQPVRVSTRPLKGSWSGGARLGRRCRTCCTTRSMPGITPSAAVRSTRGARYGAARIPPRGEKQ
jgi:hypothetical protein